MNTWMELGATVALTLTITLGVAGLLWQPLQALLEEVWQSPAAARFWTRFTTLAMASCALFLVCLLSGRTDNPLHLARQVIGLVSFGLVGGLFILGVALSDLMRPRPRPAALPAMSQPRPAAPARTPVAEA